MTAWPAAPADRADDEPEIDQIVVVAHRSGRPVRDIAANVSVVTREDIAASLATSLADVFRYVPGIDDEAAGTRFGTEGINIRGIGGNRVAMLVDGVPLGDQFDVGSFSNATRDFINAGFVQRIEVLHGPASALYGSAAIGGVVAVSTPDPGDIAGNDGAGANVVATWREADHSSHIASLLALGDADRGLVLGASFREGGELESAAARESLDIRDAERRSAMVKYVAHDAAGHTWRLGIIRQDAAVRSDLNSMLGTGRYRSTSALEGDDEYEMVLYNGAFEFGDPESWLDAGVLRAYYESVRIDQRTLDERALAANPTSIDRYFSFDQDIRGIEVNLQKSVAGPNRVHGLGFGLEYRERRTAEYRDGLSTNLLDGSSTPNILGEVFPLRDFPLSVSREWGSYLEDVVDFGDWSFIAALRADRYELAARNDPMYAEDYPFAAPVSLSESDLSPKLAAIAHLGPDTDIYLQYAHGFRAPPYEDANIGLEIPFFNYRAIPNPDLRSESSDGIELGIRWRGEGARLDLAIFRTRYEDFIESRVQLGTDPASGRILFQSQNLEKTVIEGIELDGRLQADRLLRGLSIDASLYAARGENRVSGQALNSVGPAQAVVGLEWAASDARRSARLQVTLTDRWDERDESGGTLFKPPGHGVLDLYAAQAIGQATTLRLAFRNLADRRYWKWSDVRGIAPSDPVLPYLAQPGRNVSLSIDFNWQ